MWRLLWSLPLIYSYSEPCPRSCNCNVATLDCTSVDDSSWHDIQLYLSAPDASTVLNVTARGRISTLAFFPYLQNLETLDLSRTGLRRVNFPSELRYPSLRTLILEHNEIEELSEYSFAAFPNLEMLSLRHNNLSSVKYEQLKLIKLRRLDLASNQLQALPTRVFRLLSNLEHLDLSWNELRRAMSSDFQSQQRLRHLNLSHNALVQFDFDTFAKNVRIEELDMSYNQFKQSPGNDIKQIVNLLMLNISGNPIDKFYSWDFEFDRLQILVASDMPSLRVIDASAFSKARDLRRIDLSNNRKLAYISPTAFENCSSIHSLDVRGSDLEVLFASNLKDVAQVKMEGSRLNCECMVSEVDKISSSTIDDWEGLHCIQADGTRSRLSEARTGPCDPHPVLPYGSRVVAPLGSTYYLHCGARSESDQVSWKLPDGTIMPGLETLKPLGVSVLDYFSSSLYHPETEFIPSRPRIYASREWLRIDVATEWDAGEYECTVRRGKHKVSRSIRLEVNPVNIELETISSGPHYIALSWNQTLEIQAVDRVALRLRIHDAHGHERPIQLSLHNPWTTYNVMRLRPQTNYTICLEYALAEELERPLLSACIVAATQQVVSLMDSIDSRFIAISLSLIFFFLATCTVRKLYDRLHIWQQTKKRSRMAASLSGQSIVSHSSTNGATYENQQSMLPSRRILHHSSSLATRKRRLSSIKTTSLVQSELFNCKAGIAYLASLVGVVVYQIIVNSPPP